MALSKRQKLHTIVPRRKMSLPPTSFSKGIACAHTAIYVGTYECSATFVTIINVKFCPNCTWIAIAGNVLIGFIGWFGLHASRVAIFVVCPHSNDTGQISYCGSKELLDLCHNTSLDSDNPWTFINSPSVQLHTST
jgi:hypothetical protein